MIKLMRKTENVSGDVAEFGVHRGQMFARIAALAHEWGKIAHAIDSFEGMPEPGIHDGSRYPEGKFSNTSVALVERRLISVAKDFKTIKLPAVIHKGFVPEILSDLRDIRFSFVRIDLDHYSPTADCMEFVYSRLNSGGIMSVHDYFPGRETLASRAIDTFYMRPSVQNKTAWWRKS